MYNSFMEQAISEAAKASKTGEIPVGAVIVKDGHVVSCAHNECELLSSAVAHAEILAIDKACRQLKSWRLDDCDIYVTLEPCPMCAGAILQARLRSLYFGACNSNAGAAGSVIDIFNSNDWDSKIQIYHGIMEDECEKILQVFFEEMRNGR